MFFIKCFRSFTLFFEENMVLSKGVHRALHFTPLLPFLHFNFLGFSFFFSVKFFLDYLNGYITFYLSKSMSK